MIMAMAWVMISWSPEFRQPIPAPVYFATEEACKTAADWAKMRDVSVKCFPTGAKQ